MDNILHTCSRCAGTLGHLELGDVAMCPRCGQWHHVVHGDPNAAGITPAQAAELARAPMDAYELLDAMAESAEAMFGRRPWR